MGHRSLLVVFLGLALGAGLVSAPAGAALPAVHHVFIVVLENEDAGSSFGPASPAPYLAKTLPTMGVFVPNYFGTGHFSNDNYIAMVSGQAPNPQTQADCQIYSDFVGTVGSDGQAVGSGCVYPEAVKTIADQLAAKGLTWKGYMQDMGADPSRESATCAHPEINQQDHTQSATVKDQYATRHNPLVYFHSIIDTPACAKNVVNLDELPKDLASKSTTPNYAFITPDLCNDGHDPVCADGGPGGLKAADAFLQTWVPQITGSPAFADGGLLIVTFDEAASDSAACCNEQPGPNSPAPGGSSGGPGGGRTGAVLVSPFIKPGTTTTQAYNHYSLLRSVEDLFNLSHLGFAGADGLRPFGDDIFTSPPSTSSCKLPAKLTYKLPQRYGAVRNVTVYVGKRVVKRASGPHLRRVAIPTPNQKTFKVRVVATTARNRTITVSQAVKSCHRRRARVSVSRARRS